METGLLRPAPVSEVIVLHYNYTGKLRGARYQPGAGLRADAVVCLAVCALIVLENLAVLVVLGRHPRFHAPMFLLLGSLTLSDLLAGAAYAANILLSGPLTLHLSPTLWFFREGGVFVALAASVLSLLAIALERRLTMARRGPAPASRRGRTLALAAAAWGASLLLGLLPMLVVGSVFLSLSHASPRPLLLQLAPHPCSQFPGASGQAQLSHPQTRGYRRQGGWSWWPQTFTRMVPFGLSGSATSGWDWDPDFSWTPLGFRLDPPFQTCAP
ncbi:sphingosine 1-phosphate receptor 5 [Suricata suricatta]|uniref:sphingosine 1-phosphate receptor 5 n=1 Tax=Suricata suricatta TaxID=37032 RepID=UPI001155CE56|nr:sphingosine 1-phosphate receptor 5 [Suricata suricatta]